MTAFWISLGIGLLLILINLKIKDKGIESIAGFFIFMQFVFVIVAVLTKDPIFQAIGLPQGYEWIAGLAMGGFSLWLFYLNPLKKRVGRIEIELGSVKTEIRSIKEDTNLIKNKLINPVKELI